MTKKIKVALLYGGCSGEHEISLLSAYSVFKALDTSKYQIILLGLTKDGRYFINDSTEFAKLKGPSLPVTSDKSRQISSLIDSNKLAIDADVVIPIVHGPLYEDGALQGWLEHANCAYVGCRVLSSAMAMDKEIAKRMVTQLGIEVADFFVVNNRMTSLQLKQQLQHFLSNNQWPLFVKPLKLGSSVATYKVNNTREFFTSLEDALRYDSEVLIEQYIDGREIEVAVLEDWNSPGQPIASVPGEIKVNHRDGFYSYQAKYLETETLELVIPAKLDGDLCELIKQRAKEIFNYLKCTGMARVDLFIKSDGEIYFNEINTIPGFTQYSMYPKLMAHSGIEYKDLLDKLIDLAIKHNRNQSKLITSYQ